MLFCWFYWNISGHRTWITNQCWQCACVNKWTTISSMIESLIFIPHHEYNFWMVSLEFMENGIRSIHLNGPWHWYIYSVHLDLISLSKNRKIVTYVWFVFGKLKILEFALQSARNDQRMKSTGNVQWFTDELQLMKNKRRRRGIVSDLLLLSCFVLSKSPSLCNWITSSTTINHEVN